MSVGSFWGGGWGASSEMVGIGVLRLVLRRCTHGCCLRIVGDVVLWDVEGVPTLGSPVLSTLGSGAFFRILVSCSMASMYLSFSVEVGGGVSWRVLSRSCAVWSVRSFSDKAGTLQCVGYNFMDPDVRNPRVFG